MKFIGTRLEILVSIAFLWICEGMFWPPIPYFTKTVLAPDATDPTSTTAHAIFIVLLVIASIARRDDMLVGLRCSWPIIGLVALAFLSAFWSDAPALVLRRSATLAVTTLFAIYLVVRFEMPRLVSMLVKLSVVGVVGSFVVMAVAPTIALGGSLDYPNAVRGAYTAKNTLGGMSAFGIMVAVYALRHGYGSRLIAAGLIPANLLLLYVSESVTPLILLVVVAYVVIVASAFRQRSALGFVTGCALIVVGLAGLLLLAFEWTELLAALNRNPTLTGRAEIWRMSSNDIAERPWLGYGFGAFWRHDTLEARTMWEKLFWPVPHAHNGLLEVGLALGEVGMAGVVLLWIIALYRALRVLAWPPATHVVFCLAAFVAILIENLTEYEFFRADSFFWVLFVIAFVYLGRVAMVEQATEEAAPAPLVEEPILVSPLRSPSAAVPR